ncbi:nitrite reductase [Pseudomonas sp. MYb185]|uniref:siroheme decarboxylase subunit beta n=1 Tax=Pseudomonas sp. MYb185 TaxID=1848729 RepID=UPI00130497D5|nr:nitrite reductase [Pseudomonas sp. MYb185]
MSACICPSDAELARRLIELTQAGLPLVAEPWAWIAERLGISTEDTLALLQRLQADGAIRRIAAVPNHYRLGYRHNGMTVWDVDDAHMDELGPLIGAQPFVSHCYRRPRREGWCYNLFAMVHGRNAEDIAADRQRIRELLGDACRADDMLVSSRILKKTGLRLQKAENPPSRQTVEPDPLDSPPSRRMTTVVASPQEASSCSE